MQHRKLYAGLGGLLLAGTAGIAGMQASSATESKAPAAGKHLAADLQPLNDSGASGHAHVEFKGNKAPVRIDAQRLRRCQQRPPPQRGGGRAGLRSDPEVADDVG